MLRLIKELWSSYGFVLNHAIQFIGIIGIVYGIAKLYELIKSGHLKNASFDEAVLISAAILFISLIAIATVRVFRMTFSKTIMDGDTAVEVPDKTKRKPKHSEYPDIILKTLVIEYNRDVSVRGNGMRGSILGILSGIIDDYTQEVASNTLQIESGYDDDVNEAARMLIDKGYVTTIESEYEIAYKPTYKGIVRAHQLLSPWYKRLWYAIKGDMRVVIVTIITAIITAILTALIYNLVSP